MHDSVNAYGPLPIWLRIAALLGEYDVTHCTVEDDNLTAIESFGKAHVLSITITPSDVDEILAMLDSFDPSRDKNGAPAVSFHTPRLHLLRPRAAALRPSPHPHPPLAPQRILDAYGMSDPLIAVEA